MTNNISKKQQGEKNLAAFYGGANEIRTRDLLNAIQTRYQLRYNPDYRINIAYINMLVNRKYRLNCRRR